ncbi:MAG: glycosyltransferase family 2 protein [Planctomycetia bacterium]|nr:glycosyltransferase family 2 protein [Planctomycetia bacterium]
MPKAPDTIISLTSIPPRMDRIGPTLESLLRQEARIDGVILWIPRAYRRPEFGSFTLPALPAGIEVRRCDFDHGPATKILPACAAFRGHDMRILYCDDDRIYDPGWAARLLAASDTQPGCCIAEVGEVVPLTLKKAFKSTRLYRGLATATLGLFSSMYRRGMKALEVEAGRVDICKGYGGVLVRPEFFTPAAFDIPDLLWTVDDIWLSGQLALAGIPILKASATELSHKTDLADVAALVDYVYADHHREQANAACIRYFQEQHGIWRE